MKQPREDGFDRTSLTWSQHRARVHRDYLAHVLRWGWAGRFIHDRGHRRVLEPGCGQDAPLAQTLMRSAGTNRHPELYVGVDLNPIPYIRTRREDAAATKTFVLHERFDFNGRWRELWDAYGPSFDLAVSFEVIEHMDEAAGDTYLWATNALMASGGTLLLSTPAFNGHAASNHVREYTTDELRAKLEAAGFEVRDRFGTFASWPDVKRGLDATFDDETAAALRSVYDRCREFYSDDVLACFLAPVLPDHSRNNAWVCMKVREPWNS